MGCSIMLDEKENITPGWRSMMRSLIADSFGPQTIYRFDPSDVQELKRLGEEQYKGVKDPPFDWAEDIRDSFETIVARVEKKGSAIVDIIY